MTLPWTIPSMAPPAVPKLGNGVVFQTVPSTDLIPILSFSTDVPNYIRRRLRALVRLK